MHRKEVRTDLSRVLPHSQVGAEARSRLSRHRLHGVQHIVVADWVTTLFPSNPHALANRGTQSIASHANRYRIRAGAEPSPIAGSASYCSRRARGAMRR